MTTVPNTRDPRLPADAEEMLAPREVAAMLRVDSKTVTRWARAGKLPCVLTPGGTRRYRRADIDAILRGETPGGAA